MEAGVGDGGDGAASLPPAPAAPPPALAAATLPTGVRDCSVIAEVESEPAVRPVGAAARDSRPDFFSATSGRKPGLERRVWVWVWVWVWVT